MEDIRLSRFCMENKGLTYRLNIIFGLFFLFPIFGFIIFAIKYNILNDQYLPLFFLGILAFSFFGFLLLRKLFDQISEISEDISRNANAIHSGSYFQKDVDELKDIRQSFDIIKNRLNNTMGQLEQRNSEVTTLKEVADLYFVTHDPEEILYTTLERSLILLNADIGSIFILDKSNHKRFLVKATIGHENTIKVGDRIDFETSIAKYAVINKSPVVVEDIERDNRFGRANHPHYATKSFVCMPIKTSTDVIGVLTVSRKRNDQIFTQEDVELLVPLMSITAFSYENLHLLKEIAKKTSYQEFTKRILRILASSYNDGELLDVILNEIREIIPYDCSMVITIDEHKPDYMSIISLRSRTPTEISNRLSFSFRGTIIDKALKQDDILVIHNTDVLTKDIEKELFTDHDSRAYFLLPLKLNGIMKGIMILSTQNPAILYEAYSIIKWIPNIVSIAMEKSKLSAAVIKRNQELETIRQIGNALASSNFDIKKVLNYTMDMIRVLMNVEAGSLYLVDKDKLEFAAAFNIKAAYRNKLQLKLGQGIAGYVAARGTSIVVNDTQATPYSFSMTNDCSEFKTISALCVPIVAQGKVVGVIEVLNKINSDFDNNDLELLESIGSSVSIAIENADLYRELISIAEKERGIRNIFQKYVPEEVLEKIIYNSKIGNEFIEELKTLTLLNIDIRDFSVLARRLGPQKTVSLLNRFFSVMGDVVFNHNGIVDKYLGDGFLAIFGAPVSSTKDADNAIAAALEMQKSVSDLNNYFIREYAASISMGISVHTGEVVVGNIGFDMKMDYTVIGDSVNDVFRLQEITKSITNSILITESTSRAAQSRLEIVEIEPSSYSSTSLRDLKLYEVLGFHYGYEHAA